MNRFLPALISLAFLLGASAQQGQMADGEATIEEGEIIAPSIDSTDPSWEPLYLQYEDPASLRCAGRPACEAHRGNATLERGVQ